MKKFDSDDEEHEKYKVSPEAFPLSILWQRSLLQKTEVQALVEDISVLGFVDGEWGF